MKLYGKVLSIHPGHEFSGNREYVTIDLTPEKTTNPFPQTLTLLNQGWKVADNVEIDVTIGTGAAAGKTR
jgi:hypothetical protein